MSTSARQLSTVAARRIQVGGINGQPDNAYATLRAEHWQRLEHRSFTPLWLS